MGANFYLDGLEFMLRHPSLYTPVELQLLTTLRDLSAQSAAQYFDVVHTRPPGEDLDLMIRNIIAKSSDLIPGLEEIRASHP